MIVPPTQVRHNDSHVSTLRRGPVFSEAAQADAYLLVYVLPESPTPA
jgi:hypothetical protein